MNTDPIADYFTRLRNASKATHKVVDIPASNMKREITKILKDKGYILNRRVFDYDLSRMAVNHGAEVYTKAYVNNLIIEDDYIKGVDVDILDY